ncbi:MAG: 1-deoxy-D-xylulose-5-phosphate reductoisomerase [Victivallales bacterium]|nr:1-deoxy-D-xylulose-5-phosphate reductoisomerase [Victivallales bacterium]
MKRIAILGSTGSIGTNTLSVVDGISDRCAVTGLAAGRNTRLLAEQAARYSPSWVYAADESALRSESLPSGVRILSGEEALCEAVCADDVDIVLCAIVGTAGLKPVLAAIEAGKDIALASKEILVMAGALVTAAARKSGSRLLPVDSEHCAIFQCLDGKPHGDLSRVILTCSGGPFRDRKDLDLGKVTLEQTLRHPTWSMGRKITIDSATLMNKGLEMIEAGWLFGVPEPQVDVVIHPQSIIHSMVEFKDGSVLAQMGYPDMRLPIHYCLNYPKRVPSVAKSMDFTQCLTMTFEPPDMSRFPALGIAREAMRMGGTAGAVFNAANEVAVQSFIDGAIRFADIATVVEKTLSKCPAANASTLDELLETDSIARRTAAEFTHAGLRP